MILVLIGFEKRFVLGRLDVVPGIAGDDPSGRRLALQRIEIFRLTGEEAHDRAALERAARIALANQLHEIGAELDIEDRVGLGRVDRLEHGARVDLALRRPLLGDPLDVRAFGAEQLLEHRHRRLAIFVVRRDRRPSLGRQLGRLIGQHRRLLVVRGAQAEGVAIALRPCDGVGQRLARDEQNLLLLGEIRDRKADIGEERSRQQRHAVVRHEFVGRRHRLGRLAAVILRDDLELLPIDAALGVDLLDGELPALAIGLGEGRQRRIAVDLADLDRVGRAGGAEAASD